MSSLIPSGSASGTGSMTLAAPVTNSNQTVTLPDATGTVMVSGAMPAFSAYQTGSLSLANNTVTTITYNTKEFDTNNCFNNTGSTVTLNGISTPAYSFAPNVAGYYQITAALSFSPSISGVELILTLNKNGGVYKYLFDVKYSDFLVLVVRLFILFETSA